MVPLYEWFDHEQRHQPLAILPQWGVTEETLEFEAPPGYYVARLPDSISASVPGASIRIVAERSGLGVRLTRRVSLTSGLYPVADYPKLRKTFERFLAVRNTLLVFERD